MLTMTITARTRIEHPVIDFLMLTDPKGAEYALNWESSDHDVEDGIYTGTFSGLCLGDDEVDDLAFLQDMRITTASIFDEDTPHKCGSSVPANDFYITSLAIVNDENDAMQMLTLEDGTVPVEKYEYTD